MLPYISVLVILGVLALLTISETKYSEDGILMGKKSPVLLISCLLIYLLMILKSPVTGDYSRYADNFFNSTKYSFRFYLERKKEAGFYMFTKLLSEINLSTFFYFLVTSSIICICLFFFLKRYAYNKKYAIYFYYTIGLFAFSLAGLRQTLAMSLCLLAYEPIRKRKPLQFLLIVGAAFLFHKSAVFFLPAYFLGRIPWKAKYHIPILLGYGLTGILFDRLYSMVAAWMDYDYGIESTGNGSIFLIILLIIGFLGVIYRKELTELDKDSLLFLNMHFAAILLWLFRLFTRTAERPAFYYLYASIILLDRILSLKAKDNDKEITRKCILLFSLALFGVFFIYRMLRDNNLIPYVSVFH
ncbi:EpsG family protein [Anaerocolumna xylanovorans]|uniref:EpsG family protein n=1 Tax=Anaerocolumna xylanovorans DSM 12503 TaxID=1121345 RepID=A0A1M7Y1I9_9FIRM|nr:EpsG family protein [Anaerocolumna xylanovorans]SHO45665.1 EpsG family protein [Anaerocolumna xylanovorans DSM 12503]